MQSSRVIIGRIDQARERKPKASRRVVIPMSEVATGGFTSSATEDSTGAIQVVHTVSPELAQRMDTTGKGIQQIVSAVRIGLLIILGVVIALAITAAIAYAKRVWGWGRGRSTSRVRRRIAHAKTRSAGKAA